MLENFQCLERPWDKVKIWPGREKAGYRCIPDLGDRITNVYREETKLGLLESLNLCQSN